MFIWLVLHGKILTNSEIMRRGLSSNPYYQCCPESVEDLDHLFRFCTKAKAFWNKVINEDTWRISQNLSFKEWMYWNLKAKA